MESKYQSKTYLDTPPSLVPIPALDSHIVRTSQHERQRGVHNETSDIVRVRLERGDLFAGGNVVDAELKVVRARHELCVALARALPCTTDKTSVSQVMDVESTRDVRQDITRHAA